MIKKCNKNHKHIFTQCERRFRKENLNYYRFIKDSWVLHIENRENIHVLWPSNSTLGNIPLRNNQKFMQRIMNKYSYCKIRIAKNVTVRKSPVIGVWLNKFMVYS